MPRTYSHWTNREVEILVSAHQDGHPSRGELTSMLPRHPIMSITATAGRMCLGRRPQAIWLRIAHQHFARREAGLLR